MRFAMAFAVPLVLAPSAVLGQALPTVDEAIRAYEQALSRFEHGQFAATCDAFIKAELDSPEKHLNQLSLFYRRDGERLKVEMHAFGGRDSERKQVSHMEFLRPHGTMTLTLQGSDGFDRNNQPRKGVSLRGNLAGSDVETGYALLFDVEIVLGRCRGDGLLPLAAVLRESNPSVRMQPLDGRDVFVVEGKGRFGTHRLFVDPAAGYLARRIEIEKTGDDVETYVSGGTDLLSGLPILGYGIHQGKQRQVFRAYDCDIMPLGDTFAISGIKYEERITFEDDAVSTVRRLCKLSDIKIGGSFSDPALFQFTAELPEGLRVRMSDDPDIEYEWRDGKPRAMRTK